MQCSDARPHPDPLPQERESRASASPIGTPVGILPARPVTQGGGAHSPRMNLSAVAAEVTRRTLWSSRLFRLLTSVATAPGSRREIRLPGDFSGYSLGNGMAKHPPSSVTPGAPASRRLNRARDEGTRRRDASAPRPQAQVQGFRARSCVRSILTLTLSPRRGNSDRAPQRSEHLWEYRQRHLSLKAEEHIRLT